MFLNVTRRTRKRGMLKKEIYINLTNDIFWDNKTLLQSLKSTITMKF